MELWFIYAIISVFLSGLFVFSQKVGAHYGMNASLVVRWIMWGQVCSALVGWLFFDLSFLQWQFITILGLGLGAVYAIAHWARGLSLEYIDTTIYFPLNKFLGPLLVAVGGIVFLGDSLSQWDYVGIALGATVPLMLLDRFESSRQKDLWRGLRLMLLCTFITAGAIFLARAGAVSDASIWLFIVMQSFGGIAILHLKEIIFKTNKNHQDAAYQGVWYFPVLVGFAGGVINAFAIFYNLKAFETGLISVVYTINSFYILVPIILSVFFFKEHMNIRKALAIGLSLVAVFFFQI